MITRCDICSTRLVNIKKLKFRHIIGMAENYVQHIKMCPHCKLIVTGNPFSERQLENRYKNLSKYEFDADSYVFDVSEEYRKRCARQKHFIEENIACFSSILEIGASSGYNLSLYEGKKTFGIEPSPFNCQSAKKNYDVEMFCGVFQEYCRQQADSPKEAFDMVFLSHTLEHIVNPCRFIRQCVKVAAPEYFFIEVPTFDIKFINEPYGMFCEEHVNYFTLESLENLMRAAGYHLIDAEINIEAGSRTVAGFPSLSTLWGTRPNLPARRHVNPVEKLLKEYDRFSEKELRRIARIINRIDSRKLAVWGTGHHASMLLANTALRKKNIVKFYDSDIRKHAFRIEGAPVQAFDPKDLQDGSIDTILIASYVAQPQLYERLAPYKETCRIITLYE